MFTTAGQAYFVYPGVLQPAATTAAKRWKLRFDPGVETFSFGLYISTPVPPGGGRVYLRILYPPANAVIGDSMNVEVRVDSASAPIQSVRATVQDRTVLLHQAPSGVYVGTLNLQGLFGPTQVRAHGVTIRAGTGDAVANFRKDTRPKIVFTAPLPGYVARPSVRLDVDCVDDNPAGCPSITARINGGTIASGTTGIHTDVSLAGYQEQRVTIVVSGIDSWNHLRTGSMDVVVQPGSALTFVDSAGKTAMDVDAGRMLFGGQLGAVYLRDRAARALARPSTSMRRRSPPPAGCTPRARSSPRATAPPATCTTGATRRWKTSGRPRCPRWWRAATGRSGACPVPARCATATGASSPPAPPTWCGTRPPRARTWRRTATSPYPTPAATCAAIARACSRRSPATRRRT